MDINRFRILLIGKDVDCYNSFYNFLHENYFVSRFNSNINQLEQFIIINNPDLLLLDATIPANELALNICKSVKTNTFTNRIPVVLFCNMKTVEHEISAFKSGAEDFIFCDDNAELLHLKLNKHIYVKRESDKLEALASLDCLTKVPNRRAYDRFRYKEFMHGHHLNSYVSSMMVDIDMFKQFNDNYGHSAGDTCLVNVAKVLSICAEQSNAFLFRYGGEEFSIVAPNTNFEEALNLGNKFCDSVIALSIPHEFSNVAPYVTISVGVASTIVSSNDYLDVLITAADDMLYDAKKNGRNRVDGINI